MLAGKHWELFIKPEWLPLYVFEAAISSNELVEAGSGNLQICDVVWECNGGPLGLSFYSDHQSLEAIMAYLAAEVPRSSDPLHSPNNLNFGLASQYLIELARRTYPKGIGKPLPQAQVSVRIGNHVGNLKKNPNDGWEVKVVDFAPITFNVFKCQQEASLGTTMPPASEWERLVRQRFETRERIRLANRLEALLPTNQRWQVPLNDFAITVLGIPPTLNPREMFSGIFGMIPPSQSWTIRALSSSSPLIVFYLPCHETGKSLHPQFFHQDRLVRWGPGTCHVGINYMGQLDFSTDGAVHTTGKLYEEYREVLSIAVNQGFVGYPTLALELAVDILTDDGSRDNTIGRVLQPADPKIKERVLKAFDAAWRRLNPSLQTSQSFYPFADAKDEKLIRALGHTPICVLPHVRTFLLRTTAFPEITDHAHALLLGAPLVSEAVKLPGYVRFRRAVVAMVPGLKEENVSMRLYEHRDPKVAWSVSELSQAVAIRWPELCTKHPGQLCVCWVAVYVSLAAKKYPHGQRVFGERERALLARLASHSTCIDCVEVVLGLRQAADAGDGDVMDGHVCFHRKVLVEPKHTDEADRACVSSRPPPAQSSPSSQWIDNVPGPSSSANSVPEPSPSAPPPGASSVENAPFAPAGSAPSKDLRPTVPTDASAPTRSERSIESHQDNPAQMSMDKLLEYCDGLIKQRSIKDRADVSADNTALQAEKTRLEEQLAQQLRTEEQLRATLKEKQEECAAHDAEVKAKNSQLREKDARMSQFEASLRDKGSRIEELEGSLRTRDTHIEEMEAKVKRLEGQLRDREQVMAGVKRLLDGTPRNFAKKEEDAEESLPEDTESPRKRLRADTDT
ncbi:hypothetical protein CERSUDRAFT_97011 [Gelatoporia subvermispora B]|uniref:Uncharacterized protein n=1 Tax=Ceriporiopsis subvermispora (strain B) TaxID=914234 RepID=M2R9H8_CERS8|nr:hypothetical protein CERSUDRAFT_97011 [Gelatoporia subvermispora B]